MHELSAPIDKQSETGVSSVGDNTYVGPRRRTHVTTVAPDGPETPDTPSVRRAVRADLIEIHRIEQASFPQPWPFSALESYLGEPGFLVAETGNDDGDPPAVAGYVIADTVPNHGTPLGHIKDLAVRPAHRREGVASALLRRAIEVIDQTGAGSVKLEVRADNGGARQLYRRFGFEHRKTIPNYYSNGEDALVMVRLL
jgi:ribosomal-protein-alanine N-acetyltransferase